MVALIASPFRSTEYRNLPITKPPAEKGKRVAGGFESGALRMVSVRGGRFRYRVATTAQSDSLSPMKRFSMVTSKSW